MKKEKQETFEITNQSTGEITEYPIAKLNQVIVRSEKRSNGTIRRRLDFSFCPTLAEQHTAHLSDLNYLIEKYKPDELAAYLAARSQHKREILGHDFSTEPSLQNGMNAIYESKKAFENLDPELKKQFKNHVEFLKYIDVPQNQEKLVKLGLLKPKQIKTLNMETEATTSAPKTTTTQEAKAKEQKE